MHRTLHGPRPEEHPALPEFYQGATADYVKVDGKWVDGMAQDNMLTALQNLQDAYTAG